MTRNEISCAVIEVLRPFVSARKGADITESLTIADDLNVNSARFVDIVLELEDRFAISIDDSAMQRLQTVGDIVDFVSSLTGVSVEATTASV